MAGIFDDASLDVPCPSCDHSFSVKVGRLRGSPDLRCPGCGETFTVDADDFNKALGDVDDAIDGLGDAFD